MSRLSQIETLIMVADNKSLAAASKILHISPAAVSKQLSKLEQELGVQLMIRTTRKIKFTDMGKAYLEQCRRIVEEVESANALVSQMKANPHGKLKIFSTPHFTHEYISPNLSEFLTLYPGIEIQLEIGERIPHLESENIDLMIGASMPASPETIQRRIASTHYSICASPDYFERRGTPNHPEDLKNHSCITHSMRKPNNQFYLNNNKSIEFSPYLCVNDAGCLADLAVQGLGIVQLHHYVVKSAIKSGKLVSVLNSFTKKNAPIYLALPPRRFTPSKVRCFIDFIERKIALD